MLAVDPVRAGPRAGAGARRRRGVVGMGRAGMGGAGRTGAVLLPGLAGVLAVPGPPARALRAGRARFLRPAAARIVHARAAPWPQRAAAALILERALGAALVEGALAVALLARAAGAMAALLPGVAPGGALGAEGLRGIAARRRGPLGGAPFGRLGRLPSGRFGGRGMARILRAGGPASIARPPRGKACRARAEPRRDPLTSAPHGLNPARSRQPGRASGCGGVPEWLKGTDCKSVGLRLRWFESNPLHIAHPGIAGPTSPGQGDRTWWVRGASRRGCSSMVEPQPSKLVVRVRFPSPAPARRGSMTG